MKHQQHIKAVAVPFSGKIPVMHYDSDKSCYSPILFFLSLPEVFSIALKSLSHFRGDRNARFQQGPSDVQQICLLRKTHLFFFHSTHLNPAVFAETSC